MKKICAAFLFVCSIAFSAALSAQTASFPIENNELVLPEPIVFADGTVAEIKSGRSSLEHIKNYLQEKTYISLVRIEGHASSQALSEKRAIAVCKWLVDHGIDCQRLVPVGFGPSKPVSAVDNGANFRIVVANAALRGRLIGGLPADGGGNVAGDPCK